MDKAYKNSTNTTWPGFKKLTENSITCSSSDSLSFQVKPGNQLFSLKQNCLNQIINNFEIFNDAFVNLSSEETLLCRNLAYLQRFFTPHIISGLHKKGLLRDQYLCFLINEHLKELDVGKFYENHCTLKDIEERIAVVGHGLTKVSFYCWRLWNTIPHIFCHLPNVEVLYLGNCDDARFQNISFYCPNLKELYIALSCFVTEEGLKLLCKRSDCQTECLIKVLSIQNLNVSACTIIHLLDNMPFLEVLEHLDLMQILYDAHKEDIKNNTLTNVKKYNLTKIGISSDLHISEMSDALKILIEICPNLKTLRINHSVSETEFNLFSGFSNLETLIVSNYTHYDVKPYNNFISFLKSYGTKLRQLQISNIAISLFDLIESCPKLEVLALVDIEFLKSTSVKGNIALKNLNKLILEDLKFSEQSIVESVNEILQCSPSVNCLFFKDCKFHNSKITTELETYYKNCTVEFFTFEHCDIRLDMLQSIILNCSTLKSLKIDTCLTISSKDVYLLKKFRNVTNSFVVIVYYSPYRELVTMVDYGD